MSSPAAEGATGVASRSSLVFGLFLVLYALGAARTVQGGDAGEFMTIAATGGVAHPPGYPAFSLLVRLTALLPVAGMAWKASLASALCAAGALAVLHRALVTWTASPLAGWAAATALGFSPAFWRYATVAEVFSAGALTAALVLLVVVRIEHGWQGARASAALGLAVATGIANHHTVVLLAPLAGYALWRSAAPGRVATCLAACAAGLLPGFAIYGLLALPGGVWRWGGTDGLSGLVHHFLRLDYGTFTLAADSPGAGWWEHPWTWMRTLPDSFVVVFLLLALAGAVRGVRSRPGRGLWIALLASLVLAGPAVLARFDVLTSGLGLVVATRFHILPNVLLAALVGLGVAWAQARRWRWIGPVVAGAALASALLHGARGSHADWTVLEDYVLNALEAAAPNALLLVDSDNLFGGALYAQTVLGVRPDVVVLLPDLLARRWYREHVRARHPDFEPASLYPFVPVSALVANSVPVRPVYVSFQVAARHALPATYPESGVLLRVATPDRPAPSPEVIEAQMLAAREEQLQRSAVETGWQWQETWEGWVADQYAAAWFALADRYGPGPDARRCWERALALLPPAGRSEVQRAP